MQTPLLPPASKHHTRYMYLLHSGPWQNGSKAGTYVRLGSIAGYHPASLQPRINQPCPARPTTNTMDLGNSANIRGTHSDTGHVCCDNLALWPCTPDIRGEGALGGTRPLLSVCDYLQYVHWCCPGNGKKGHCPPWTNTGHPYSVVSVPSWCPWTRQSMDTTGLDNTLAMSQCSALGICPCIAHLQGSQSLYYGWLCNTTLPDREPHPPICGWVQHT